MLVPCEGVTKEGGACLDSESRLPMSSSGAKEPEISVDVPDEAG